MDRQNGVLLARQKYTCMYICTHVHVYTRASFSKKWRGGVIYKGRCINRIILYVDNIFYPICEY